MKPAGAPRKRTAPKIVPTLAEAAKAPGTPRKKAAIAGPRRVAERPEKAEPSLLERMQEVIVGSLTDDKAEDVQVLDLAGRATFTDRMVIATGLADRQISAMATHLEEKLAEIGIKRVQIEGAGSDWVLLDAGDVVVHLFKPEARALYALEKMWGPELDEADHLPPTLAIIDPAPEPSPPPAPKPRAKRARVAKPAPDDAED